MVVSHHVCGCLELKPGFLEEQSVFLIATLSPQLQIIFKTMFMNAFGTLECRCLPSPEGWIFLELITGSCELPSTGAGN